MHSLNSQTHKGNSRGTHGKLAFQGGLQIDVITEQLYKHILTPFISSYYALHVKAIKKKEKKKHLYCICKYNKKNLIIDQLF